MTIPDPPWKQKTRPCPFYSQGRCLFSDSCNFLHEVKVKVKATDITKPVGAIPDITLTQSPSESDSAMPSPASSILRVRSPPRSPRMSSLLLALGDIIEKGEDGEDLYDESDEEVVTSPTFTRISGIFGQSVRRQNTDGGDDEGEVEAEDAQDRTALTKEDIGNDTEPTDRHSGTHELPGSLTHCAEFDHDQAFWPVGQLDHAAQREDSFDSGYADNWTGPSPFVLSPPKTPSTRRYSTLDLLSSPFGTPSRVISPKFAPSNWPSSPLLQHTQTDSSFQPNIEYLDELDSPSPDIPDRPRVDAPQGPDYESTIRRSSFPPLHDTASEEYVVRSVSPVRSPVRSPTTVPEVLSIESTVPISPIFPSFMVAATPAVPTSSTFDLTATVTATSAVQASPTLYSPAVVAAIPSVPTSPTLRSPAMVAATPAITPSAFNSPAMITATPATLNPSLTVKPAAPRILTENEEPTANDGDDTVVLRTHSPLVHRASSECAMPDDQESSSHTQEKNVSHRLSSASTSPAVIQRPVFSPPAVLSPTFTLRSSPSLSRNHSPDGDSPVRLSYDLTPVSSQRASLSWERLSRGSLNSLRTDGPSHEYTDSAAISNPVSPTGSLSSSVPYSPKSTSVISRQPSASDISSQGDNRESRGERKVPFGFRHSMTSRSRDSSVSSRHTSGSAPPARHRPPALNGLSSNRSSYVSRTGGTIFSPDQSSPSSSKLKPLRLSMIINSSSSGSSLLSSGITPSLTTAASSAISHPPSSPSVSSDYSMSHNRLFSPTQSSTIPSHINNTLTLDRSLELDGPYGSTPHSAPITHGFSRKKHPLVNNISSHHRFSYLDRPSSRLSEPAFALVEEDDEYVEIDENMDDTIRGIAVSSAPAFTRPASVASMLYEPVHAIATPRPTLLFAIASDNVEEVRRVLESGEAGPNDDVGPQSALAFALTANQLKHKTDIVKLLLAHGANPSSLKETNGDASRASSSSSDLSPRRPTGSPSHILDTMDPATRYYIARAEAPQTRRASALIHRSFFRPLTKVRYDMIGQDRALEQLFRVLSMPTMAPIVVLLCGPSGHGKSLLARRFGFLLDVPTHTVNMTTLRSTHDIWRSYSMSPYEAPSTCTLADFLMENEGKRCVVVLDEIEKTENEKVLSSLLMPWELGRCSFEAGHRHVDVSKVIWLGTSNVGHDLVFEHQASRESPEETMSRDEYLDLMTLLRPRVSDRLGPSLLSRVTTVLPFVPFTVDEKMAIATEALYSMANDDARNLPAATVEKLVHNALHNYVPAEGARSLYRGVSTELLDIL